MTKFKLLVLLTLAGCAPTGTPYSQNHTPTPDKRAAQIVIYHPKEFTGSVPITPPDIKINGVTKCELPNGGYCVASSDSATTNITSTKALSLGTSILTIKTAPNKRYFVRVTWNTDKVWAAAGAGLVGEGIAEGVSSHSGPFVIELVEKSVAESELADLRMVN